MHPSEEKAHLRNSINERIERYPKEKKAAESRSASRRALELLPDTPTVLCAYYPIRNELDVRLLLEEALARGHALYLPRFDGNSFSFVRCDSLKNLKPGGLQIPEPPSGSPLLKAEELAFAFIPARAYNRKGERLGRGNGGYDKWIRKQRAANPDTKLYGICYECQ